MQKIWTRKIAFSVQAIVFTLLTVSCNHSSLDHRDASTPLRALQAENPSNPHNLAETEPSDEIEADEARAAHVIIEVTILVSDFEEPKADFRIDFWDLMAPGFVDNPLDVVDQLIAGTCERPTHEEQPSLHVVELHGEPARLICAIDDLCDTTLCASPKVLALLHPERIVMIEAGQPVSPATASDVQLIISSCPDIPAGIGFTAVDWDEASAAFDLALLDYAQPSRHGGPPQLTETCEGGPDFSGEGTPVVRDQARFTYDMSYLVGGFPQWRVHPDPNNPTRYQEMFAIIKITRVDTDLLLTLPNPAE